MNLTDIKTYMPFLAMGTTKDAWPHYGCYVVSNDDGMYACNDLIFISIENTLPFNGVVNFHVLDDLLKRVDDAEMSVEGEFLKVKTWNMETKINLENVKVPFIEKPDCEMLEIDEDMIKNLKIASRFCGGQTEDIFIGENMIIATDGHRFFSNKLLNTLATSFLLPKKIASILAIGNKIGVNTESNNIVVSFDGGYMIFTLSHDMESYPLGVIKNIITEVIPLKDKACSAAVFKNAILDVSHVLLKEDVPEVEINNVNKKMSIKACSMKHGEAEEIIDTESDSESSVVINTKLVKTIPNDYDMSILNKRLLFTTEDEENSRFIESVIVVMSIR